MIIEKKATLGDIITIKMSNGDELVAKFKNSAPNLVVTKPLVVLMSQQGFGLMPYALTVGPANDIHIDFNHVVFYTKTIQEVANEYIRQTTGLMVVSNQN